MQNKTKTKRSGQIIFSPYSPGEGIKKALSIGEKIFFLN